MGISEVEFIAMQDRMRRNGAREEVRGEQPEPAGVVSATPDQLEAPIQMECTKILEEDGWRALRTDPVSDRGRGKGFGEPGMADYLYIRYWSRTGRKWKDHDSQVNASHIASGNETMWIEFKRSKGGRVSKAQREWHTKERARGALTLIAGEDFSASVEGFRAWYRSSGLCRNPWSVEPASAEVGR